MTITSLVNTNRLPFSIIAPVETFALSLLSKHGENILSILVYGSAAGVDFNPIASDINMAVVLKTLEFHTLDVSLHEIAQAKSSKITAPLFLTKDYINQSTDVFPIEFEEIKDRHVLIYGEDVFGSLSISPANIRLFCEAQIKGKILRIRQAYLESAGEAMFMRRLLHDSLNGLMPICRQLLRLKKVAVPNHKKVLIQECANVFSIKTDSLMAIYEDRHHYRLMSVADVSRHVDGYLTMLVDLAQKIDAL